jgi:acetoin utilization protein AcuB
MLAQQLTQNDYPPVKLFDKISFALQLMEDYDVQHLPVINEDKFVGIIGKEDLLDGDETSPIASIQDQLVKAFVKSEEYFLAAIKTIAQHQLSLIAVVNDQMELTGVITLTQLTKYTAHYLGCEESGGIIVLETEKRHFSFGEISRLVETNDAYITQLNTSTETETGLVIVTIKINKPEISDIVATLQRYDYSIRYYFGEEQFGNELKENFNQLMFYLNI